MLTGSCADRGGSQATRRLANHLGGYKTRGATGYATLGVSDVHLLILGASRNGQCYTGFFRLGI